MMTQIRTRDLLALLRGFPAIIAVTDQKTITLAFDYLRDLTATLVGCVDAKHHLGWAMVMQGIKPALEDLFPLLAVEELPDGGYWRHEVQEDARRNGGIPQHRLDDLRRWVLDIEGAYGATLPLTPEAYQELHLTAEMML